MQASHGLVPDAPIPDRECWYRLLTNRDHVTRDDTVHYQALKGGAFQPPEQGKPWAHELSGRLSSIVADICAEAEAEVERIRHRFLERGRNAPSKIRFVGVACAAGLELRTKIEAVSTDVVYSPLSTDAAHSNFVTYQTISNEDLDPVRNWLMKTLRVINPQCIDIQISSCGRPPSSAG